LVNNCIHKFCEMVKNWPIEKKHQFFIDLIKNLQEGKSSIPSLKLLRTLIKDHFDNESNSKTALVATGSYPA
jgi:hypothetical protein